jgi:hypothetical protein
MLVTSPRTRVRSAARLLPLPSSSHCSSTVTCSAVQCSAVQCGAVQCTLHHLVGQVGLVEVHPDNALGPGHRGHHLPGRLQSGEEGRALSRFEIPPG